MNSTNLVDIGALLFLVVVGTVKLPHTPHLVKKLAETHNILWITRGELDRVPRELPPLLSHVLHARGLVAVHFIPAHMPAHGKPYPPLRGEIIGRTLEKKGRLAKGGPLRRVAVRSDALRCEVKQGVESATARAMRFAVERWPTPTGAPCIGLASSRKQKK